MRIRRAHGLKRPVSIARRSGGPLLTDNSAEIKAIMEQIQSLQPIEGRT